MSDVKYTKKASARIIKEVQKIDNKAPLTTTFDQAFVLLMTEWELEIGIETTLTNTKCSIYRDKDILHTFEWTKAETWSDKDCDWDWNFIYKTALEHIIKTRMYKKSKTKRKTSTSKSSK
jgi:hypothetical protein